MQRAMLEVNGVQTQVMTEGRWVEEGLAESDNKHIVLTIPGNPGIPEFYEGFIKSAKSKLPSETPVWVVGHAGHVQPAADLEIAMPRSSSWAESYGLTAQVRHKEEFIKKYVPEDAKLHLVGHSIGCWLIINLLKDPSIANRVEKCYMLFPTIEYLGASPNGWFFTKVVSRVAPVLIFLCWILSFLPVFVVLFLVRTFGLFYGIPAKSCKAVYQLLNPRVLKRVLKLAREELESVKERNDDILTKYANKFWFYYGAIDGWTPISYYNNMKSKYPTMDIQLCKRGFYHSFVLQNDKEMGQIVGDLINESISKSY